MPKLGLALPVSSRSASELMRSLKDLIDDKEPAWPLVQQWIADASVDVDVLPTTPKTGGAALHAMQVTTRSPMGAIVYSSAGIIIDSGWLRVPGAGGHARFQRSLPEWNRGRSEGYLLVADDAVGGFFAINGGALGTDRGNIYYYAPDSLKWEPCELGYSDFLVWSMSGKLSEFAETLRWKGWQLEVKALNGDQSINFYPFLFAKGPPLKKRSRKVVSVTEQYELQLDMQRQLDAQ